MTITNVYDKDGNALPDKTVSAGDEVYANHFYIHDALNKALHLDDVEVEVFDGTNWVKLTLNTDYEVFKNSSATAEAAHPITNTNGAVTDIQIELTEAGMKKVEGNYTDIRAIYHTHTDVDFNGVIENEFNGKQDKDEPTWSHADIERDYWLVETKSPDGFELLKDPIKVTVKIDPADVGCKRI